MELEELKSCERDGAHGRIFEGLRSDFAHEGRHSETRALASFARACAFLGKTTEYADATRLLSQRVLDPESSAVALLASARMLRQENDWPRATEVAEASARLASRLDHPDLLADAKFALAYAWVESGHLFQGAALFQEIRRTEGISRFRRSMAAHNEAWILWDLGQIRSVREAREQVPEGYLERLELALSLVEGDLEPAFRIAREGPRPGTAPTETPQILQLVGESFLISGRQVSRKETPWLFSELELASRQTASKAQPVLIRLGLGLGMAFEFSPMEPASWREKLQLRFVDFLIACRQSDQGPDALARYWTTQIDPVLDENCLQTPLIPRIFDPRFEPATPWAKMLCGMARAPELKPNSESDPFYKLDEGSKTLMHHFGGEVRRISFEKHPTSWQLLKILSGDPGRKVSKQFIHEQLTLSKYNSSLHDNRIHQLIRRLAKTLQSNGAPTPWIMAGDNKVTLRCGIRVLQ